MSKPTGGSAYPRAMGFIPAQFEDCDRGEEGMTLRNYYKAAIAQGLAGAAYNSNQNINNKQLAKLAGSFADALLDEDLEACK